MKIPFLKYRKICFLFSGILVLASLFFLIFFGLNLGIDFVGGSILEIEYLDERPSNQEIKDQLKDLDLGTVYIQPTGDGGVIIRMKDIGEETHQQALGALKSENKIEELRFELIGSVIGKELKQKTKFVIILSILSIVSYIAFAFRKISRPIASWQYGIASLIALSHDILIPVGIFAILGKLYGVQMTIPVVVGLLTVLGYSINNTVVIFDRIRENIIKRVGATYEEAVNSALNQTLGRSINTSLTTLFVLVAIFVLGGETLRYFSLALILGIVFGTYSSIFLASPILVSWLRRKRFRPRGRSCPPSATHTGDIR